LRIFLVQLKEEEQPAEMIAIAKFKSRNLQRLTDVYEDIPQNEKERLFGGDFNT
jgi:hypothetical protein